MTVANGIAFFIGDDGRDRSLWRSDGTSAGTLPLAKMSWARLADVDGTLFALTTDELWTSDGTRAGTVRVADIDSPGCYFQQFIVLATGKGRVYFWGEDVSGLWTSDGTAAGTVQLTDGCPDFE